MVLAEIDSVRLADGVTAVFPARTSSLSPVRALIAGALAGHARADDAVQCASELAANACLHTRCATFTVAARAWPRPGPYGTARVVVIDGGRGGTAPHLVEAAPDAPRGRGLALVAALATRWGYRPAPPGWLVWCELAAAPRG